MSRGISRRRLLGVGAAAVAAGSVGWLAGTGAWGTGEPGRLLPSQVPLPHRFRTSLPIPAVLQPVDSDTTTDYYEIVQRPARLEIMPGLTTDVWTYHGSFPGPTIRSRSGRRTVVRHRNQLPEPVVVHLHGGHTPAASDGYPMDVILPEPGAAHPGNRAALDPHGGHGTGTSVGDISHGYRDYDYPMRQRAATLWYHDHSHGFTGPAVWHGLAGFHLVHDSEEESLPLPSGERDIPLMITDRSFAVDGSFRYPMRDPDMSTPGVTDAYMNGVLGDVILVNGAPWPVLTVDRANYRLRLLNASNARRYRLELDPPPPGGGGIIQIGSDGGLLERPITHDALDITPAERFDVVVDFSRYRPGTQVRLVNRFGSGTTESVMLFDVAGGTVSDHATVPHQLSQLEPLDPSDAAVTRTFHFHLRAGQWTVNGHPYQPGRALARPRLGVVERWRLISDFHHPVHVHLDPFQVISRNNRAPGQYDHGWKDTVDVRPSEAVEIAVRFTDYPGVYMVHCHNLEHEDMAMMADFVTLA